MIAIGNYIGRRKSGISWSSYWSQQFTPDKSYVVLVQGDSTGNGTTEWVYLLGTHWASVCPSLSVGYRLWNDTFQNYDGETKISTGTGGHAYCNKLNTDSIITPDKVSLRITGDIEMVAHLAANDWTSGTQTILSKFGNAGNRGYAFQITSTAKIYFWYSTDGTANFAAVSTIGFSGLVVDGADIWLKVTVDVDNGAGGSDTKFYTSNNGTTWTQLGTTVTGAVISIYASTQQCEIGSRGNGLTEVFSGKIYEVIVRDGIGGKIVLSPNFGQAIPVGTTFKDAEANIWTKGTANVLGSPQLLILNASQSGAALSYSSDVTRFGLQTPIAPKFTYINYSHNEGADVDYTPEYQAFCEQILTKYATAKIICTVQNPQRAPEVNIVAHATRVAQIRALAIANDYGYVDVYNAFISRDLSTIMADGVHPNAAGSIIWRDTAIRYSNRY